MSFERFATSKSSRNLQLRLEEEEEERLNHLAKQTDLTYRTEGSRVGAVALERRIINPEVIS